MRRFGFALLAACYAPRVEPGSPCDPGPCPVGQSCSQVSHTCVAGDAGADTSWLTGYAHRKRIRISEHLDEALVDFPVSVALMADPDLAAGALADGSDIVFTGGDGTTRVDAERVAYAAGSLEAWVRASLAPGASTTLFIYYGGASEPSAESTSSRFAAVWHMGGGATAVDSAASHHDASASSDAQLPATASGVVGDARDYDGVDDLLEVGDPAGGDLDFGTRSFSYSVWVNVTASVGPYDIPFHKGGSSASTHGYDLELGTGPWNACLSDNAMLACTEFGDESGLLGRWVHLTAVVDRAAGKLETFVDRAQVNSLDISSLGSLDNGLPLTFGVAMYPFHGLVDEIRIHTTALTASWIAAEYDNLMTRDGFLTIGPAETP